MNRFSLHLGAALTGLGLLAGMPVSAMPPTPDAYHALIVQARDGDTRPALQALRATLEADPGLRQPGAQRRLLDHVIIASWSGEHAEAQALHHRYRAIVEADEQATMAAADSLRHEHRWPEALALYEQIQRRHPPAHGARIAHANTLADAGQGAQALALAEQWQRAGLTADGHRLAGYAHSRLNQPYDALAAYDRARQAAPADRETQRAYLHALERVGMAGTAQRLADRQPDTLPPDEQRALALNAAAELVRLSALPAPNEAERFTLADRAIARYDALLADWQDDPAAAQDSIRARLDRLGAWHSRHAFEAIVAEYAALSAAQVALPDYALTYVASAYLSLRRPDDALPLYRTLAARLDPQDPARHQTELGLFYALLESERHEEALAYLATLNDQQPILRRVTGQAEGLPNDARLDTQLAVALARLYVNDTAGAQHALESLRDRAPFNQHLHTATASLYQARQWPRRSEAALKLAETLAPRNPALMVEQGQTALMLQAWQQAVQVSDHLQTRVPEMQNVQRLKRRVDIYRKTSLNMTGSRGLSSQDPVSGSDSRDVDAVLYSPPIAYRWRGFAGVGMARGTYDRVPARFRWMRAGVEWRDRGTTAELEASAQRYGVHRATGARLSLSHELNDHWRAGSALHWRSRATPLRALAHDIHSNQAEVFIDWTAHEGRAWSVSAAVARFEDGNVRHTVNVSGRQRIVAGPRMQLDATLSVAAARNREMNTPYFNPRAEFTVLPRLELQHILWRRYEQVWSHQLSAGLGRYWQHDHGSGTITTLSYGHRVQWNDVVDAGLRVATTRRPYDGRQERDVQLLFDLNLRF